jgi:3-methylcrotonyl-CoA carboxylase alpha subunit
MDEALTEYRVEGVHTNLPLLRTVVSHPTFRAGEATTYFLESSLSPEAVVAGVPEEPLIAVCGALVLGVGGTDDPWLAAGPRRAGGRLEVALRHEGTSHQLDAQRVPGSTDEWTVHLNGRERRVRFLPSGSSHLTCETDDGAWSAEVLRTPAGINVRMPAGRTYRLEWSSGETHVIHTGKHRQGGLSAPMPGLVLKVLVRPGDKVRAHQTLIVIEAMKMEHNIEAPFDGTVKSVNCAEGGRVAEGAVLIELERATE